MHGLEAIDSKPFPKKSQERTQFFLGIVFVVPAKVGTYGKGERGGAMGPVFAGATESMPQAYPPTGANASPTLEPSARLKTYSIVK